MTREAVVAHFPGLPEPRRAAMQRDLERVFRSKGLRWKDICTIRVGRLLFKAWSRDWIFLTRRDRPLWSAHETFDPCGETVSITGRTAG